MIDDISNEIENLKELFKNDNSAGILLSFDILKNNKFHEIEFIRYIATKAEDI